MIVRWLVGLALGAALLAVLTLPPRPEGLIELGGSAWWRDDYAAWPYPQDGAPRDVDAIRLARLQRALQQTDARVERMAMEDSVRRLLARELWAPQARSRLVAAPKLPRAAVDRARLALQRAEAELDRVTNISGIRLLLVVRTNAGVQPQWPGAFFLPPSVLDGRTCGVIVTLSPTERAPELSMLTRMLGPCVYQAAFGVPGAPLQRWLASRAFAPTADWDWSSPEPTGFRAAPSNISWWRSPYLQVVAGMDDSWSGWQWSVPEVGCRLGDLDACSRHLMPTFAAFPWVGRAAGQELSAVNYWRGEGLDRFAADLLQDVGPERFGEFWRSAAPLDSGFLAATGVTMPGWDRRWLLARRGPTLSGPVIRPVTAFVWLLLSAIAVGGSLWRARQRTAG